MYATQCQNFDFNLRMIIKKISYERRDYDSVGEKKTTKKEFMHLWVKIDKVYLLF